MIKLHPQSMALLGLRPWRRRCGDSAQQAAVHQSDALPDLNPPAETTSIQQPGGELPSAHRELLEKILQAIGESPHACEITVISATHVSVGLPDGWRLEFDTLREQEDNRRVYLTGLGDMLMDPALKRPVWRKLKQWARRRKT